MKILKKNLNSILFIIIILQLFWIYFINKDIAKIRCDLQKSIFAERTYVYPILKTIADPNNFGENVKNPITSDSFYNCKN